MEKKIFGHAELADKMASKFGSSCVTVKVEMSYEKEVQDFIRELREEHRKTSGSKLKFA